MMEHRRFWDAAADTSGTPRLCRVVGEVAQAHDGSLGMAHAFIDAIASAGADAVKFQTHIASAESSPDEPWRVKFSTQDRSRFDYWKRMEFTEDQWRELKTHADARHLVFISSPFSIEAVELLGRIGVRVWKIASGEANNQQLLDRVGVTGLPVILSTGMSPLAETDTAVQRIRRAGNPLAVLQCTSAYPCPPERVGLNLLPFFRARYNCAVGLSDHSGTIFPSLAATILGAEIIEVHVTLSREMFGPDVSASVTTDELRTLVAGVECIDRMNQHPIDKDMLAGEMDSLRGSFTKSIVAVSDLPAGTVLREDQLSLRKPGTGIPASRFDEVLGRRLKRAVAAHTQLREDDFE